MKRALALAALFAIAAGTAPARAQEVQLLGPLASPQRESDRFAWSAYARSDPARVGLFQPIVVADLDYWASSAPDFAEGPNGFQVGRLYLGGQIAFASWASVLATFNPVQHEGDPLVLDALLSLRVWKSVEINLGAGKTPLFSSARDEYVFELPIPELPMVTRAFWPGRDVGMELHRFPTSALPIEGWLRVGNGTGSALGNDNNDFALDARLDVVLGRARAGVALRRPFGLRIGAGVHAKSNEDKPGLSGSTADGFQFFRPVAVAGPQRIGEAHLVAFAGPVKLDAAAAYAREGRLAGGSGDPEAPRAALDPVISTGEYVEVAWMITGQHRGLGAWPVQSSDPISFHSFDGGSLEIAGRVERLDLDKNAKGVTSGGATAGAASIRWWTTRFLAFTLAGYKQRYDAPPLEEPKKIGSWLGLLQTTVFAP